MGSFWVGVEIWWWWWWVFSFFLILARGSWWVQIWTKTMPTMASALFPESGVLEESLLLTLQIAPFRFKQFTTFFFLFFLLIFGMFWKCYDHVCYILLFYLRKIWCGISLLEDVNIGFSTSSLLKLFWKIENAWYCSSEGLHYSYVVEQEYANAVELFLGIFSRVDFLSYFFIYLGSSSLNIPCNSSLPKHCFFSSSQPSAHRSPWFC